MVNCRMGLSDCAFASGYELDDVRLCGRDIQSMVPSHRDW